MEFDLITDEAEDPYVRRAVAFGSLSHSVGRAAAQLQEMGNSPGREASKDAVMILYTALKSLRADMSALTAEKRIAEGNAGA